MATDDSQPSTPVREVVAAGVSPVSSSVVSSPASSSMSLDVSSFLKQFRLARSNNTDDINSKMAIKRAERDEAKLKAKGVAKDLKKLRTQKARSLKKTRMASAEELMEALAARAESAEKKKEAIAAAAARAPTP